MVSPYCLIISGSSGTGKSTTAKRLWETNHEHMVYLNLDSIKHFVHEAISDDYFLDLARVSALILTKHYLNSGHPVILEKAFGKYDYVKPFVDLAKKECVPVFYFKLVAPLNVQVKRVEARTNAPLKEKVKLGEWPFSVGDRNTVVEIYEFFEKHQHEEGTEISTDDNSLEEVVSIIRSHLAESLL